MIPLAANPEKRHYNFEQYITLLRNNEQRLEYDHGEIYAMAGSSANHAAISANMWRALDDALGEDTTCRAYMVDRVVRLTPDVIVMPDVVVTGDKADQDDAFFWTHHVSLLRCFQKAQKPGTEPISCCVIRPSKAFRRLYLSANTCNTLRSLLALLPAGNTRSMDMKNAFLSRA